MKEPNEALAPEAPPGTPEANLSGPAKSEKSPLLREVRSLAVLLAVLSIGMVIEGFVSKAYRDNNEAPINLKAPEMKGIYWMLLIFAVYCVVLRFGGFILASVIFIPSVMWVLGERKWLRAILVGVIATAAIYALFKFGLRVRLPQGVLFKL